MDTWEILAIQVLIGIVAGAAAGNFMRGRGYGLAGNLVIGLIGALVGRYVFGLIGLPPVPGAWWVSEIITAFLGAVLLLFGLGLVRRIT
jgi:uncharacterized membrane protein YeaQ/YmgE (transglycosylase-associated protein family)